MMDAHQPSGDFEWSVGVWGSFEDGRPVVKGSYNVTHVGLKLSLRHRIGIALRALFNIV